MTGFGDIAQPWTGVCGQNTSSWSFNLESWLNMSSIWRFSSRTHLQLLPFLPEGCLWWNWRFVRWKRTNFRRPGRETDRGPSPNPPTRTPWPAARTHSHCLCVEVYMDRMNPSHLQRICFPQTNAFPVFRALLLLLSTLRRLMFHQKTWIYRKIIHSEWLD